MVESNLVFLFAVDLVAIFAAYLIVTCSLNLEFGYTGIPDFGKMLAFAGGAFTTAFFPGRFLSALFGLGGPIEGYESNRILADCIREYSFRKPEVLLGLKYIQDNVAVTTCLTRLLQNDPLLSFSVLLVTVVVAAGVGAVLGFIASYPGIRVREDYLAMTLLAMAEIVNVIGYNYPEISGGTLGVAIPDPYSWVGSERRFLLATVILAIAAALTYLYVWKVSYSPFGRLTKAVRDGDVAAEALGKNVLRIRQNVFVVSSAIAAVGGALWAFYAGGVIATAYDRVTWTFWPWVMVIMGGAANNLGVVLGTGIFVTSRKLIDFYKFSLEPILPFSVVWVDRLALGLVLVLMLVVRPQGIIPEKAQLTVKKDWVRLILDKAKSKTESSSQ